MHPSSISSRKPRPVVNLILALLDLEQRNQLRPVSHRPVSYKIEDAIDPESLGNFIEAVKI